VDSSTAKAVRGGWAYDRNLAKKIFANAFNDYEYDKFQSLDLRVVIGGGVVGAATACALARRGADVVLLEAGGEDDADKSELARDRRRTAAQPPGDLSHGHSFLVKQEDRFTLFRIDHGVVLGFG